MSNCVESAGTVLSRGIMGVNICDIVKVVYMSLLGYRGL